MLFKYTPITLALLASSVTAQQTIDAFFDDRPTIPAIALQPIGNYMGINYNGFKLATLGVEGIYTLGLKAHSDFNIAAYGTLGAISLGPPNMETTNGPFDLHGFYYGCVVGTQETVISDPLSCTVTIRALNRTEIEVSQDFHFQPTGQLSELQRAVVDPNKFSGVTGVNFETTSPVPGVLVATVLDNFNYTMF